MSTNARNNLFRFAEAPRAHTAGVGTPIIRRISLSYPLISGRIIIG